MARPGHPIHAHLARLLAPAAGPFVDLGCGAGGTLAALAEVHPQATLIGLDADVASLDQARALLADRAPRAGVELRLERADLERPLPLPDASAGGIVCHNVLECLAEPAALLREAARVLRPGGVAVWSHVDFDAIVVAGAEPGLDRRVLHAYADLQPTWAAHADGRAGRKLAGLVRESPLVLEQVGVFPLIATALDGDGAARVDEIAAALIEATPAGAGGLVPEEIQAWRGQLAAAARRGAFLLAELAFVAASRRPPAA